MAIPAALLAATPIVPALRAPEEPATIGVDGFPILRKGIRAQKITATSAVPGSNAASVSR